MLSFIQFSVFRANSYIPFVLVHSPKMYRVISILIALIVLVQLATVYSTPAQKPSSAVAEGSDQKAVADTTNAQKAGDDDSDFDKPIKFDDEDVLALEELVKSEMEAKRA